MTHHIEIKNMTFLPNELVVETGDEVIWKNKDGMKHSATRYDAPAFDTGLLVENASSQPVRFTEISAEGYEYFCTPHPFMKGRVKVKQKPAV